MSRAIPIYRDDDGAFYADTCQPLLQAAQAGQLKFEALARGHYPGHRLHKNSLPGLKTIGYWDAVEDQNWGLDWHRNEGIEIGFLESGELRLGVDGAEHTVRPQDLTITRPWQLHRVGDPRVRRGRYHWLILDVGVRRPDQPWKWPPWILLTREDLNTLANVFRQNERPVWRASGELTRCFQATAQAIQETGLSQLAVRINEIFLLLLDLFRTAKVRLDPTLSGSRRTVQLFLADLPNHLEAPWTAEQMADACGLGLTQFVHYVRHLTNLAPIHYLNQCRLTQAAQLLRAHPEIPITEIALSTGFSSSQYFATLFRTRYHTTPRDFRKLPPAP